MLFHRRQDYMTRWRTLEGQNREKQEVLSNPATFGFTPAEVAALKAKVIDGLHLAQAQGACVLGAGAFPLRCFQVTDRDRASTEIAY
jgi:predicted amino acid dehydrogenase